MKNTSVEIHNEGQYNKYLEIDYWIKHNERHQDDFVFNNKELKIKDLLDKNINVNKLAIDIGSGAGWLSAKLSNYFETIISIEPSEKAVEICKEIYKNRTNINWNVGFAEDILNDFDFGNDPVLFVTCSVFMHLDDSVVQNILKVINEKSPIGSILSFQELWGLELNQNMHHVRTKEWWSENLSNWNLDFHGPLVLSNTHKGIHGIRK